MKNLRPELRTRLAKVIAEYGLANSDLNDGIVLQALVDVVVAILAYTSSHNREESLRLFGPWMATAVEEYRRHYEKAAS